MLEKYGSARVDWHFLQLFSREVPFNRNSREDLIADGKFRRQTWHSAISRGVNPTIAAGPSSCSSNQPHTAFDVRAKIAARGIQEPPAGNQSARPVLEPAPHEMRSTLRFRSHAGNFHNSVRGASFISDFNHGPILGLCSISTA